jgi:uncharacterized cupin superfamily protein
MTEARLVDGDGGWLEPEGEGWFILNARDAKWQVNDMGWYCNFEGAERFPEFGFNLNALPPGKPMALYHHEPYQEGFLVLRGDALLIVDGEERPLREWDYVHMPRDVPHVIVAGERGAFVLAVGSRVGPDGGDYPVDPVAIRHGAGRTGDETSARDEYAKFGELRPSRYPGDVLPE